MTLRIPLLATPSQTLTVTLGNQRCEISVVQKFAGGVFLSLKVDGVSIANSAACIDRVPIVRQAYRPFVGRLVFIDTQGTLDPDYREFDSRYKLVYLP